MKKSLIIVESPTKVKTISKFLGEKFLVKSSLGHIRDLPKNPKKNNFKNDSGGDIENGFKHKDIGEELNCFGVDIKNGFKPIYEVIPGKKKIIDELKSVLPEVKDVYLATDPDREGEAIAWHIKKVLKLKDEKRIEFHEITKKAVENALSSPRKIDLNLVYAQEARRILDRIVGYGISPLLWEKIKSGLSAGRVQSIAVLLVVEREKEIEDFKPVEYWEIIALLNKDSNINISELSQCEISKIGYFEAKLVKKLSKKIEIKNEEEAKNIISLLEKEEFIVDKIEIKKQMRQPPPPLITSTLCQEANRYFGFSAAHTMMIAQQLYEGVDLGEEGSTGLITYMRTDSLRISEEIKKEALNYIKENFGEDYLPKEERIYKSKKLAQEAHEAIRPTSVYRTPESIKKYLNPSQYKIYQLIYKRFLASCMASQELEITTVDIKAGDYLFQTKGKKIIFDGFRKIYEKEEENGDEEEKFLPTFEEKEKLILFDFKALQHFTKPPSPYTEATLIKTLEEKGIGRPSTYAPIMETILKRKYVIKDGKFLRPTELGKLVTEILLKNFPEIMDVDFTAKLEEKLDEIEEGKIKKEKILAEFYENFEKDLKKAKDNMVKIELQSEKQLKKTEILCEKCGENLVVRESKYGKFLACPKYPKCEYTRPYIVGKCKREGCDGEILEKKSKKGKIYYICSNYPKCKYLKRKK
jgi:DNA topoisomerase-1